MIYFIIPAYNEAANLPELLLSLTQWAKRYNEQCHVIVVDDGSTDGSADILNAYRQLPLTVVRHMPNRGVAQVFRSGFQRWSEFDVQPHDLVVTLEADNTSSLEILHTMVEKARSGNDVVLASCYSPSGEVVGTNLLRSVLSFCANLILRCTPGMPNVYTFSSFYRVHRGAFLNVTFAAYGDRLIEEEGYVCVVEMLLKFGLMGARICEVPLRLDGSKRKGPSKMKIMKTIRGYLQLFMHASTGSLARPEKKVAETSRAVAYKKAAGGR